MGRSSELVITGGYNVYPREVEDAVRTHPRVADVAVVGVLDPTWGEVVIAFVVPVDGLTIPADEDLTHHVEPLLAPYKRPRRWLTIAALPRNGMGKVQRDVLRDLAGADSMGG